MEDGDWEVRHVTSDEGMWRWISLVLASFGGRLPAMAGSIPFPVNPCGRVALCPGASGTVEHEPFNDHYGTNQYLGTYLLAFRHTNTHLALAAASRQYACTIWWIIILPTYDPFGQRHQSKLDYYG